MPPGRDLDAVIDWNHLRLLTALKRGGSIAAAARDLGIDHGTVSRQLAALETAVGTPLLVRGRRGLGWTPQGARLLDAAAAMEAEAASAVRDVRDALAEPTGVVRLSVPTGYLPVVLRLLPPRLAAAHPGIRVDCTGTYRQVDLAAGEADVAVRMARPEESDLIARQAFREAWFAYADRRYVATRGRPAAPEALRHHALVLFDERLHALEPLGWMDRFAGEGPAVRVDNIEAAVQIAAAGGGVAVLPAFVAHGLDGLVRLFPEPVAVKPGWIVFHESLRRSARVRAVASTLASVLADSRAVFEGAGVVPVEAP